MTLPARKLGVPERRPLALHDRAMDNLRYIRETMERSGSFTHVSGIGGVVMGLVALVAAFIARSMAGDLEWLAVWIVAAGICLAVAAGSMARKSRAEGVSLLSGPGRKFLWSVTPSLVAGAVLTLVLAQADATGLLPGIWLLLYGSAVVTGGSHSVRPVPLMGVAFMVAGAAALLSPAGWGDIYMAAGFGGLHILFGIVIWRKHGG
ncbi:MAG: hypothetical protein R3253_01555 [Longimicrobiales bacterium]|nr:hypothetical protein [Longimicrobiales bacterium]